MKPKLSTYEPIDSEAFRRLKAFVIAHSGLVYYLDKDRELHEKLISHFLTTSHSDFSGFLRQMQQMTQPAPDLHALLEKLTIGETYFFRFREQLDALRDEILPGLLARRQSSRRLRIWCAGCATGEEAYTLSILLHQTFDLTDWRIEILGTDMNRHFLTHAEKAVYRNWSFRQNPPEFKASFFEPVTGESWRLLPGYREWVRFLPHNLILDPLPAPEEPFDLILCRNVLIYFAKDAREALVHRFYQALSDEGWLLVGPSELSSLASEPFPTHPLSRLSCFPKQPEPGVPPIKAKTKPGQRPSSAAKPEQAPHHGSRSPSQLHTPSGKRPGEQTVASPSPARDKARPPLATQTAKQAPKPATAQAVKPAPRQTIKPAAGQSIKPASGQANRLLSAPVKEVVVPEPARNPVHLLDEIRHLANRGQLDAAAPLCRSLVAEYPLETAPLYQLALIQAGLGEDAAALSTLQSLLYLDRNHVLGHYHIGLLQQKAGNRDGAQKAFRNAMRLLDTLPDEQNLSEIDHLSVAWLKGQIKLQQQRLT